MSPYMELIIVRSTCDCELHAAQRATGNVTVIKGITLAELFDRYCDDRRENRMLTPSTLYLRKAHWSVLFSHLGRDTVAVSVTQQGVVKMLQAVRSAPNRMGRQNGVRYLNALSGSFHGYMGMGFRARAPRGRRASPSPARRSTRSCAST